MDQNIRKIGNIWAFYVQNPVFELVIGKVIRRKLFIDSPDVPPNVFRVRVRLRFVIIIFDQWNLLPGLPPLEQLGHHQVQSHHPQPDQPEPESGSHLATILKGRD